MSYRVRRRKIKTKFNKGLKIKRTFIGKIYMKNLCIGVE